MATPRASFLGIVPTFPGAHLVHADPPVYQVDGFLSDAECTRLIAAAAPRLRPSTVVHAAGTIAMAARTSATCFCDKRDMAWLHDRVAALTGSPVAHHEAAQVARYMPGQQYTAHQDAFDATTAGGRACMAKGGQRVATVLMYLNDVAAGGATAFPKLGMRFQPRRGHAIVFFPATTAGELDERALHAAEPAKDVKWVSQVWVRQEAPY